ncbi:asparagine synthase [Actinomadura pelletieri DSM 43383]|uniref:Asparagine synthase n=1 Tax=Actinomadura pelletieri DSM 43383 TaxID=1120940 RepID=A0A495Q9N2_9ACTN|nr:asparagine synthase-related protein [Actinomadura pelletieri]RKS68162.1 asparagine synthase [Actinomadura pelletieri DSM 43383]
MKGPDGPVRIHGHCRLDEDAIRAALREGRAERLVDAGGAFVIVARGAAEDVIVSSRSVAVAYHHGRAAHGRRLADVAATLPFAWNHRAVADFLVFAHPLGDDTFHPGVRLVPPGSVSITRGDGGLECRPAPPEPGPAEQGADAAARALVDAVRGDAGAECGLSMSGGLDSRVLLAALLRLGHRPTLFVSGVPGSFDREVASAIARRYDLPLVVTRVEARTLLDGSLDGDAAGIGLLPLTGRAGLEHLRVAAGDHGPPILLGVGGEYARGYYAAGRGLSALRQAALPGRHATEIVTRRYPVPLTPRELEMVHPALRDALHPEAVRDRVASTSRASGSALDRSDEFFLTQYARHKISAELASLDGHVRWRAPFLDPGWVRAVRALPRRWKLGSRLHRYCVARLWPSLLDFPEAGASAGTLARRPPPAYWLTGTRHPPGPHYLDQRMFRSGPLVDLVREHRDSLEDLVQPELIDALAAEQAAEGRRPHLTFGLLALGLYRRRVRQLAGDHRAVS